MTDLISGRPASEDLEPLFDQLGRLLEMLGQSDVQELTLETAAFKVRVRRNVVGRVPESPPVVDRQPRTGLATVTAPLVGTFYRAPNPGAEPFVSAGQTVEPGQVVGIVEAMKVMNEITTDVGGRIVRILVEDGQPVEFGQPLMEIDPQG